MPTIHPQAVASSLAEIARDVVVAPLAVIEPYAVIGEGCRIASGAVIKSGTILGRHNEVGEHAVIGGLPQHLHVPQRPGRLVIGDGNTLREYCTVHRSLYEHQATLIGDNNLLMVGAHVAHDCVVGDQTILTNNVLLAGHVVVEDRAYLAGASAVHQFCRVGRLAMVGGHARVIKDVPPYVTVDGGSSLIVGLNTIGLRRAGFTGQQIEQLKVAYRVLYRSGLPFSEILPRLNEQFPDGPAAEFHRFLSHSVRGVTQERRSPPGATLRIHRLPESDALPESKAG